MRKWLVIIFLATLSSCNINSSTMFRTSSKYAFSSDTIARNIEYRISTNDILSMNIFTNNGSAFMDKTAGVRLTMFSEPGTDGGSMNNTAEFRVDFSGEVRFPTIGKVSLRGLTLEEGEKLLEDKYSKYYVNPFVVLKVTNKRVLVFPGFGGSGKVVDLRNDNTTLIEALAIAGGIQTTGKAKVIKLIRPDSTGTKVYRIDLSGIEGVRNGNMILQANDIIYVEPAPELVKNIFSEITPVVATLTSLLLIYEIVLRRTSSN